jgi:hypothetical protein
MSAGDVMQEIPNSIRVSTSRDSNQQDHVIITTYQNV